MKRETREDKETMEEGRDEGQRRGAETRGRDEGERRGEKRR